MPRIQKSLTFSKKYAKVSVKKKTPMREIVLDTETTGLSPTTGHRIVEIAALELVNRIPTGQRLHFYINPERDIDARALEVHGLTRAFLADKPVFAAIADELLRFLGSAPLVIHNAAFDMRFLNSELAGAGQKVLPPGRAVDTLSLANRKFPGAVNTLEALCKRLGIAAGHRKKHGALIDAELLASVYIELSRGKKKTKN